MDNLEKALKLNLSDDIIFKKWIKLNEPEDRKISLFLIILFAFINTMITLVVLMSFNNPIKDSMNDFTLVKLDVYQIELLLLLTIILVFVHKLLHIIFIPNFRKFNNKFWRNNFIGIFFVSQDKVSKKRYIGISALPFVTISIFLPIVFGTLNLIDWVIIYVAIFNSIISSIDILKVYLVGIQTPKNVHIIRIKRSIYYKIF